MIAGELKGAFGAAHTVTAVELWDVTIAKGGCGGTVDARRPYGAAARGRRAGDDRRDRGALRAPGRVDAHRIDVPPRRARREGARDRRPAFDEPVVGHGSFVMNTWNEISRAIHDFDAGRFGTLRATVDGEE